MANNNNNVGELRMLNECKRKLLSVKETANVLGVSERTVWTMTAPRGRLVSCRLGHRVLYSIGAIEKFIEQQEREANYEK